MNRITSETLSGLLLAALVTVLACAPLALKGGVL